MSWWWWNNADDDDAAKKYGNTCPICTCPEDEPYQPGFLERIASFCLSMIGIALGGLIVMFLMKEFKLITEKREQLRTITNNSSNTTTDTSESPATADTSENNNNAVDKATPVGENENGEKDDNATTTTALIPTSSSNIPNNDYDIIMELIQYRLDYYFSTSPYAKPALLFLVTYGMIVLGAIGLAIVNQNDGIWIAWTYVADPGTHADAEGTLNRLVSFVITIGGMVIFALMIGIISETISDKVDDLKQGKSRVMESNHTLILGWSDKSLAIIEEICLANESEDGGVIVVLAMEDKLEMEAKLQHAMESTESEHSIQLFGTQVIFRSGNPLLEHELKKVSVNTARSIIVLSPPDIDPDKADSLILRQVLALKAALKGKGPHIVVEMQDIDNKILVDLVDADQQKVEVIVTHDIIGRLMIQCAREPGLAHVLESLLGFDGDEFYFEEWSQLHGKTFLDITCRFNDAVPVGVKRGTDQRILINPSNDYIIEEGDQILCLAEDNDTYEVNDGSYQSLNKGLDVVTLAKPKRKKEKLLFCGLRRDMADMITLLDDFVTKGSELWLFNEVPVQEREDLLRDKGNKGKISTRNLVIRNAVGNPIIRSNLRLLTAVDHDGKPTGNVITLDEFDSILIFSDSQAPDTVTSDSRSLASLLLVQDLQLKIALNKTKHSRKKKFLSSMSVESNGNDKNGKSLHDSILDMDVDVGSVSTATKSIKRSSSVGKKQLCDPVGEILETRTRSLLQVAGCGGYVMSNHIVSMMLASVSEDRDMNIVLGELLSSRGSECKFLDVSFYLPVSKGGVHRTFWDVALLARKRREVALGYKPQEMAWTECIELILNPPDKAKPRLWVKGDIILVLALD